MKWNGSIYYNVISQDNVRVDRAALKRVPCPPYYQRYRDSPEQTEPGSATTQPKLLTPFAFLIWTGTDSGRENGWRGPDLGPEEASGWWLTPQRWKTVSQPWSHLIQSSRAPTKRQGRDSTPSCPENPEVWHAGVTHARMHREWGDPSPDLPHSGLAPPACENHLRSFETLATSVSPHADERQQILRGEAWASAAIKSSLVNSNVQPGWELHAPSWKNHSDPG